MMRFIGQVAKVGNKLRYRTKLLDSLLLVCGILYCVSESPAVNKLPLCKLLWWETLWNKKMSSTFWNKIISRVAVWQHVTVHGHLSQWYTRTSTYMNTLSDCFYKSKVWYAYLWLHNGDQGKKLRSSRPDLVSENKTINKTKSLWHVYSFSVILIGDTMTLYQGNYIVIIKCLIFGKKSASLYTMPM